MEGIINRIGHLLRNANAYNRHFTHMSAKMAPLKHVRSLTSPKSFSITHSYASSQQPEKCMKEDNEITKNVISMVNHIIDKKEEGRLFAVVQVCGKQFKITNNDILVLEGYWPPDIGDKIRLEKVLLLGSKDFTLIGRPLLSLNQVSVKATVIEKCMSHTRIRFKYVKRKQYKRIQFQKEQQTFLRINSIEILNKVNDLGETEGDLDRVF